MITQQLCRDLCSATSDLSQIRSDSIFPHSIMHYYYLVFNDLKDRPRPGSKSSWNVAWFVPTNLRLKSLHGIWGTGREGIPLSLNPWNQLRYLSSNMTRNPNKHEVISLNEEYSRSSVPSKLNETYSVQRLHVLLGICSSPIVPTQCLSPINKRLISTRFLEFSISNQATWQYRNWS